MSTKGKRRREDIALFFAEMRFQFALGRGLSMPFLQRGFVIEEVEMAGTAMLEQADHGPRAGRVALSRPRRGRRRTIGAQEMGER